MKKYVLTNGLYYVGQQNKQWQPVGKLEYASMWTDPTKAANVLKSLPPLLRNRGYRIEEKEVEAPPANEGSAIKQISQQSFPSKPLSRCGVPEVEQMMRQMSAHIVAVSEIRMMMQNCESKVNEYNKIQEDLLHKMEFSTGAHGQAAHIFAEMHRCRQTRRVYKDMYALIQSVMTMTSIPDGYLDAYQAKLSSRTYNPRSQEVFS